MGGPAMRGEMTLVYQGESTAVLNIREGIFIEREIPLAVVVRLIPRLPLDIAANAGDLVVRDRLA